jgi:hypothetical protein
MYLRISHQEGLKGLDTGVKKNTYEVLERETEGMIPTVKYRIR